MQARVQHRRVSWHDLEHGTQEFGGVRSVILRLWRDGENQLGLGLTFSGKKKERLAFHKKVEQSTILSIHKGSL